MRMNNERLFHVLNNVPNDAFSVCGAGSTSPSRIARLYQSVCIGQAKNRKLQATNGGTQMIRSHERHKTNLGLFIHLSLEDTIMLTALLVLVYVLQRGLRGKQANGEVDEHSGLQGSYY